MMEQNRYMGIDFGEKRIGIALTDPLLTFAYAHTTFQNDKNFWKKLGELIKSKDVSRIILGMPHKIDNPGLAEKIRIFKKKLENKFNIEVIEWDEQFTSVMAQAKIIESVPSKKKRKDKGLIDRNAAAIILQEYLDSL